MKEDEKNTPVIKTYSKQELAELYNVNRKTFRAWIIKIEKKLPLYSKTQQIFTPAQVVIIFEHLGDPGK